MEENEELKIKYLKYIQEGYSRKQAFKKLAITVSQWTEIYDETFEEEIKKVEDEYDKNLNDKHLNGVDTVISFDEVLNNYKSVDFNDRKAVEDAVYRSIMAQALMHPENSNYGRNAISLLSLQNKKSIEENKTNNTPLFLQNWNDNNNNGNNLNNTSNDKEEYILKNLINCQSYVDENGNIVKDKDYLNGLYNKYKEFLKFIHLASYLPPYPKQIEMVEYTLQDGIKLLLAARDYGKTDYITILMTAYKIATIPNYDCMIITKEEKRCKQICREVKNACVANGIEFEVKSADELRIVGKDGKEASLLALPSGSTSYRGHHVGEIILDDPVIPDDVSSPASRERTITLYNELNNLSPNITIIGQPVHKKDLYNVLKESSLNGGEVKLAEYPHGSIPERDKNLETLRKNGVSEEAIGANYLLKLRSSGQLPFEKTAISPNDNIFNVDRPEYKKYGWEMWIDPAKRQSGRDYTAVSINMVTDDFIYSLGFAWKSPWNVVLDELAFLQKLYRPKIIKMELNGLGDDSILRMKEYGINAVAFDTKENKEEKISSMSYIASDIVLCKYVEEDKIIKFTNAKLEEREIRLIEPNKTFISLFKDYEYGLHDDAVDTTSSYLLSKGIIRVKI